MANPYSAAGMIELDTAGGLDGPFNIQCIVIESATTAGTQVIRGSNSATGPILAKMGVTGVDGVENVLQISRQVPGIYLNTPVTGAIVRVYVK